MFLGRHFAGSQVNVSSFMLFEAFLSLLYQLITWIMPHGNWNQVVSSNASASSKLKIAWSSCRNSGSCQSVSKIPLRLGELNIIGGKGAGVLIYHDGIWMLLVWSAFVCLPVAHHHWRPSVGQHPELRISWKSCWAAMFMWPLGNRGQSFPAMFEHPTGP